MSSRFKVFGVSLIGISAGLIAADLVWKPNFKLDLPESYYKNREQNRKRKEPSGESSQ
jgi:hypothetical protein